MGTAKLPTQGPQHVQAEALRSSGGSLLVIRCAVGATYTARLMAKPRRLSGF